MATAASAVIRRAADLLQELLVGVRWQANELVRWLNDGEREIAVNQPNSTSTATDFTCVAGARQTIPEGGITVLDVLHNVGGRAKAIRGVSRDEIDAQVPGWMGKTQADEAAHFVHERELEPTVFYLYPPIKVGNQVRLVYSRYPTPIDEPADDAAFSTVAGNVTVTDAYTNALVDYIVYRALSKESEYASAQKAALFYAAFAQSIGLKVAGDRAPKPVTQA